VHEEMMTKLKVELEERNLELAQEEKRLVELNQKFTLLRNNGGNPAVVLQMHDQIVKERNDGNIL
jgi:hypothetical protein